jgi:two-component system, response regulator RpfG
MRDGMKVAIVDDTPVNLLLMEKLVARQPDCVPVPFGDPAAGLRWCLDNEPDLIIVDYMMPVMDGLEFIQRVRAMHDRDDVPILMVTANHERQTRYDALMRGANDFLTKPIDKHEFEPRVRNMLRLRQAHLDTRARAEILAEEVRRATAEIFQRERETIMRLARAAEFRDPETGAHIQRMARYSALIAERLGMSRAEVDNILQAAPMHDVGKLGIPDYILLKPGRLNPEEREIMKQHAMIGHDILKDSASLVVQLGASIALSHHEKYDGTGYPGGLAGERIPIEGRIVAVADVFDAITSERPYKRSWPIDEAVAFLREGRGTHFDPVCVDTFFDSLDEVLRIREQFRDD